MSSGSWTRQCLAEIPAAIHWCWSHRAARLQKRPDKIPQPAREQNPGLDGRFIRIHRCRQQAGPAFRSGKSFPKSCGRCGTFINMDGRRPRPGHRILSGRLCSCRTTRTTCRGSAAFQAIIRPITILRPGSCAVISPGARSCGAGILNRLRLRRPIFISMNC